MELRYFDHNATTPLAPEAKQAWTAAVDDLWLNPSSPYRAAARVHAHLQEARGQFAQLLGVTPERVAFNSGASEGNNAVFEHWAQTLSGDVCIGVGPTEHPSVIEAAKHFFGDRVIWLKLDADGVVDEAQIPWPELAALSVMAANNETGLLNPWQAIAASARRHGVQYHCDASQWIGKMPLAGLANCDFVTGCAHKFGGPRGVGFWLLPSSSSFSSLKGGAQESGRRAGTEDLASILAMLAALQRSEAGLATGRDAFEAQLSDFIVLGQSAKRLWNTSLIIAPKFTNVRWIRGLEKRGFLVSSGSACAAGKQGPSHVLHAMGIPAETMQRVLRVSAGATTTVQDWILLADAVRAVAEELTVDAAGSNSGVISID